MADTFKIQIATPERLLGEDDAVRAQIPAQDGYIGVLPGHAPLISCLGIGVITYVTVSDQRFTMAVRGGFLEILNDNVRVLPDFAEKAQEINATQAEDELRKAQEEMVNPALGIDIAAALIAVRHQQARIDATAKESSGQD